MDERYRAQASLLVRALPALGVDGPFALKGGTAINLFVRDLPRLSVDIDLAYVPVEDRATSLAGIAREMEGIASRLERTIRGVRVQRAEGGKERILTRLFVQERGARIRIEVTPVLRGVAHAPAPRTVSPRVEEEFGFAEVLTASDPDLWAGKLVAALDRQHPRDLFDARGLLAHEGLTDDIREAFVVYLLSHDRPTHEVLAAHRKDISHEFRHGFEGMTTGPVSLGSLLETRETLVAELVGGMPQPHRDLLAAFQRGEPDWGALPGVPHTRDLPAVRWKAANLAKLAGRRRGELAAAVEEVLASPAPGTKT